MTTALDLITDALFEIGVAETGQTLGPEDAALGLRYLNRLLQRWSNMRLLIPALTDIPVTLDGSGEYTIGPSGDVTATRPNKVIHAWATDAGGLDYPVQVISQREWIAIALKDVDAPPDRVWYEQTSTNGTIHVYPDQAGYTLTLSCQVILASFASLSTAFTLPEGYESAIVPSLADDLRAPFSAPIRPDIQRRAAAATRALKRTHIEPLLAHVAESTEFVIERGY